MQLILFNVTLIKYCQINEIIINLNVTFGIKQTF